MKKVLDSASMFIIYALAALFPLTLTPFTTEYYETAKFFFLIFTVLSLLALWTIRLLTHGKLSLSKTPIDIFLMLFLGVAIISTILSQSRNTAIFGLVPKMHGSLIYISGVILLYFLVIFNVKTLKQITTVTNLMIASGILLSFLTLLTYFKLVPGTPLVGSLTNTSIYIAMLLPLTLRLLFTKPTFGFLINLIFASTLILLGNLASWVAASFALLTTVYFYRQAISKILPFLVVLLVTGAILTALNYSPNLAGKTPLGKFATAVREAELPFNISWKISAGAFRDAPLIGTGPSTYLYDFTGYKPVEINRTNFWNVKFNNAADYFLQTLAELGGLGTAFLLAISIIFILFWLKDPKTGLASAGVTFIVLMALSPLSILTQTAGFMILALAFASREKQEEYELSFSPNGGGYYHPLIPTFIFLPLLVLILAGAYFTAKLAIGEYYHRQALNSVSQNNALNVYNNLVKAEKANPYIDLYRTDLAQTNFALANAIALQKGSTEASPGGSLTDADRNNIKQLISQSISEGRTSVAISPRSANNWEILATIYRQISGVATNGLQFSLDSYGKAIQLDPLNPQLRLAVGGVYYQLKNYDMAVRFFDDAVSLKPDYSNALYNLAIALRDKGAYKDGVLVTEKLVAQLQGNTSSSDYQLASELLADLKTRAPSDAKPSTEPSSALEGEELPKVLDLPSPENIATPPAVKK